MDPTIAARSPAILIPADRIDKAGQGLLNVLPMPNTAIRPHIQHCFSGKSELASSF